MSERDGRPVGERSGHRRAGTGFEAQFLKGAQEEIRVKRVPRTTGIFGMEHGAQCGARFGLRTDPIQRADHKGMGYGTCRAERMFELAPASAFVGKWLECFKEYPPRQKPGLFSLGDAMDKIIKGTPNN